MRVSSGTPTCPLFQSTIGASVLYIHRMGRRGETRRQDHGLVLNENFASSSQYESLRKLLRQEVNFLLSRRAASRIDERVCGVEIVSPFTIENGLLTQTLKQRRDKISSRDSVAIEKIYMR